MPLKGLYTALITPFDEQLSVDKEALKQNIQFQLDAGCDGLVILGTTAETPTLSHDEQETIIKLAVDKVKGKIPLFIGTGSYSTEQTILNTKKAQELGAYGALIVTPYYNKPTQEGIFRHFKAIAEAVDFPILVYNIQGRTGQNITTPTLKRLADLPQIVGVKEASGNIFQMMEIIDCIAKQRPDFSVLSGDDNLTLPLIALGGHGVISVVSNLVPILIKALVVAALQNNYQKARELHYALSPIFRGAFLETNPTPIKTAMNLCGMRAGGVRLPLCELSSDNQKELQLILQMMNIGNT